MTETVTELRVLIPVAAVAGPYLAYAVGVGLADRLWLYPALSREQIYLSSIPVGLVAVSTMIMGVTVSVEHTTESAVQKYYGHTESIPEYLLFLGTIMFFGTLVPDMFDLLRARFAAQPPAPSPAGTAGARGPTVTGPTPDDGPDAPSPGAHGAAVAGPTPDDGPDAAAPAAGATERAGPHADPPRE